MDLQELLDAASQALEIADDAIAIDKTKMYLMGVSDLLVCMGYEAETEVVEEMIGEIETILINLSSDQQHAGLH